MLAVLAGALLESGAARAHGQAPVAPDAVFISFAPDLILVAILLLVHLAYGQGVFPTWRRAGRKAGLAASHLGLFAAGEVALLLALVSPLESLSGTLLSAHMVQHVLLIAVAPPLLVLGRPEVALLWAMGGRVGRSRIFRLVLAGWRAGETPMRAAAIHSAVVLAWHVPAAFDAAIDVPWLHDLEHLTFFLSAMLFFSALLKAARTPQGAALGALASLITLIYSGMFAAILTFAPRPLYDRYVATWLWGMTALEDQQLAGLIMWVPTGFVYLGVGLALFARMLTLLDGSGAARRRERRQGLPQHREAGEPDPA
ncbi:cytochrome c oxidase assembly protein [Aquabacter spiritensis]|uniref:cytochrome c oxidase assembly protein n=1 Tax=Aquabacter spiritensis TaxID=933073 RepID=UPI0014052C3C|nr:cytochrome c oxidase assembly protein [Aquabacter spiritensis]